MPLDSIRGVNYRSAPSCLTAVKISRDIERFDLPLHQMQNRVLHGAGIMAGLDVTVSADGFGLVVSAGMALDALGQTLRLSDNGLAAVSLRSRSSIDADKSMYLPRIRSISTASCTRNRSRA